MTARSAASGFSLIETLVALAVIAAMSAMFFETVSANAHLGQTIAQRRAAVLLAQSLLAEFTAPGGGVATADAGTQDDFAWRVTRIARNGGARDSSVPLQEIHILVTDRASGRVLTSVRTLRLAR